MPRPLLTLAVAAALLPATAMAEAPAPHTPDIACKVLLAPQTVPNDPGFRVSIQEVTVAPGHDGHKHDHGFTEFLTVTRGTGTLSIAGQPDMPLEPDTVAVIPPKVEHQAHNASDTEPLVFTATFLESVKDHLVTEYDDEPDKRHGCPHKQK